MIYPMLPFPVTLSDPQPRFQGHGVIFKPDALGVLCAVYSIFVIDYFAGDNEIYE